MPMVPVNNVGELGVVLDRKPHEIPLNAWSAVQNVRFRDGFAEKFFGESQWAAASIAPYFLLPVQQPLEYMWLYAGLTKVYAFDGTSHTNITRQTLGVDVDYTASADTNWTGGLLNGIPVINNGVDVPQMWTPANISTKLQALSNWDAAWFCSAMRPFREFLIAMDVTKSGTRYGQMVKWSHGADAGVVPSSWDETDPSKDAGEYQLAETAGFVLDSMPLRDVNIVYKEDAIYLMQYIGGEFIFRFSALTKFLGLLSRRCAVEYTAGFHAAFCQGDIVRHDGQRVESIVDGRTRKWVFANIDQNYYQRSFVVNYASKAEVWFCFPMTGNAFPNIALVWNWSSNTMAFRQLRDVAHIAPGLLSGTPTPFDSDTGTWDEATDVWDTRSFSPAELSLVQARPNASEMALAENTNQFGGSSMTCYLERRGITLPVTERQMPDFTSFKFMSEVWPRIEGTDGGQVLVTVGTQNHIDGDVIWETPVAYTIGTTQKIDCRVAGRLLAVRFESTTDVDWRLHGYEMNIQAGGKF